MANGTTTTTPQTTGTDYTQYQKLIEQAAARTRDVQGLDPATLASLQKSTAQLGAATPTSTATSRYGAAATPNASQSTALSGLRGVGEALVSNLQTQEADLRKRAESSASALEVAGQAQMESAQNIDSIRQQLQATTGAAANAFAAASDKADEYVQAARGRVQEVLSKVDGVYESIQKTNDFAKAHDMQAAVQASIGSMRNEERNIAQVYGTNSAEYTQFKASKSAALATVQSNIHASYAKLKAEMDTTYLGAVSDAYIKANTAISYQEQQHVEMLNYRAQNQASYSLKVAEVETTLEQLRTAGLENLANWILETPTYSMDATSTVTAIADLLTTQETTKQASALNAAQASLTGAQAQQAQTWANYMGGTGTAYGRSPSGGVRTR